MAALVLRGFLQRKLRVLLTGIAIALGVALMAGTYILTDTINHSFAGIFSTANKGHDVVVSPAETLGRETQAQTSPINERTLAQVRAVPGVAEAAGGIFSEATFLNVAGKRLSSGGAPSFVAGEEPARFESFSPAEGRFPTSAGEVAIDQATAKRENLKIGERMQIAGIAPAKTYTIVGIAKFAGGQSFGGAATAILTPAEAQRVVGKQGSYDNIDVAAAPGITPTQLRERVRAALPASDLEVRTGAEEASNQTANLESDLGFLRTFLLVFAYVALVVGAFIIFNTFSITVAQRTREFAMLRTLGASRGQIMRAVVFEGLLLGVIGAVLGLLLGLLLAPALDQLFKAFGADLPDSGTVLETRTIVVSLLVGIVVTVLAGLFPALRATRVPPLAAMREGVEIPPRPVPSRRVLIIRFVIALIVVIAISAAIGGTVVGPVLLVGLVIRAIRLRARLRGSGKPRRYRVVPALGRAIGLLVSWRGVTGRLARENSVRQPGRTLVTALALTVGLALVAFISVLAAGTKATINQAVDRSFAGDLIVENSQGNSERGIPAEVAPAVRQVQGVSSVTPVAFTLGRVRDLSQRSTPQISKKSAITAIEPVSFDRVYRIEWASGSNASLLALGNTGTIVNKEFAKAHHVKVGQRLSVLTPSDKHVTLTVVGVAKDNARLLADLTISLALARTSFGQREDGVDFVSYGPGADGRRVQATVNRLLTSRYPQARSRTAAEFKQDQSGQINKLLILIYVLLALSVIVSLFGIVNTLILSIYERTRELGMMRAIGTSRSQVRQMIRYESIITGLIGGVFGLVIGTVGAVLTSTLALSSSGFVLSIPVGTLFILLILSALAGLLAAQLPARRAARLNLLEALAAE
jgi:putative ABC transport system permease protein